MTTFLQDDSLSAVVKSYDFQLGSNFTLQSPDFLAGSGTKRLAIDEFLRVLPFEAFDRDPLAGVTISRCDTNEPTPAYLPGDTTGEKGGAYWFVPSTDAVPDMEFSIESAVDTTYETFVMRRLGAQFQVDPAQLKLAAINAGRSKGPDPLSRALRAAQFALLRTLSRDAINNIEATDTAHNPTAFRMFGLAKYYDNGFGGGSDPQVIKSTSISLEEVRNLIRRVGPAGDGFGVGPNALLMSRRCRDVLVALERASHVAPAYHPDPANGSERRYHFDGIPVYCAPVREDEDVSSATTPGFAESGSAYDRTSIYALRLGGPSGIRMLHLGGASESFGMQVEQIAPSTSGVGQGYIVQGLYTLLIPERQSCARLWGVDISSEAANPA